MAQLVARGVWDAEVASSSLVAPTNQGGEIKKRLLFFIEPTQIGMVFAKRKTYHVRNRPLGGRFCFYKIPVTSFEILKIV